MDNRSQAVGGARGVGHHVVVGLVVLGVVDTANLSMRNQGLDIGNNKFLKMNQLLSTKKTVTLINQCAKT